MKFLGVLAGEDFPLDILKSWAESADVVVAADSAADRLIAIRAPFHHLVGDFDSLVSPVPEGVISHGSQDQDTTDCEKLLLLVEQMMAGDFDAHELSLVGFEGDEFDHSLAALLSAANSPLPIRMLFRRGVGYILREGDTFSGEYPANLRGSLIPLCPCTGVSLEGVKWPLKNEELDPFGRMSVSNQTVGGPVTAQIGTGKAALFLAHEMKLPFWRS